eukprot:788731_1
MCCESCNTVYLKQMEQKQKIDITQGICDRDVILTKGFIATDSVFASDKLKAHENSKYHLKNKQKLEGLMASRLKECWDTVSARDDLPDALKDYIPAFYVVYFGVKHHYSLRSMIGLKSDLLQMVLDYFTDKLKQRVNEHAKRVFARIQKVMADEKVSKPVLDCVARQADRFKRCVNDLNVHQVPTKYKNTRDVKGMIAAIASIVRG